MTHTARYTARTTTVASASHLTTFTSVVDHETLAVQFVDRTGGAVILDITDNAGGTSADWDLRSTYTDGVALSAVYVREDCPTTASLVVTITTAVAQNSQTQGTFLTTDAGGVAYPTYNNVATVIANADSTNCDSNTCALSANGCIAGFANMNNGQATTPTVDVGDSIGAAGASGARVFNTFDAQASAGSYAFGLTLPTSSASRYHVVSFVDSGAAAGHPARNRVKTFGGLYRGFR